MQVSKKYRFTSQSLEAPFTVMIDFNEDELSNHANLVNDPTLCQNEGCTGSKWLVRAPDGTDVEVPFVFDPQVIDGIAVGRGKPCAQLIIDQDSLTLIDFECDKKKWILCQMDI